MQQVGRQYEALAHPQGKLAAEIPPPLAQVDLFQGFFHPRVALLAPEAETFRDEAQVLLGPQVLRQRSQIGHVGQDGPGGIGVPASIPPGERNLAVRGFLQRRHGAERRRLPRAVRPEQSKDFPTGHLETEAVQRHPPPVVDAQVADPHTRVRRTGLAHGSGLLR